MRKLILAMVLVMGKENEENGKVMPRFQSRKDSSLDQLQAEHLLQCYLSDSQLHSGKTKAASTPKAAHLFSTCSWIFPMNNTLEVQNESLGCNCVFQLEASLNRRIFRMCWEDLNSDDEATFTAKLTNAQHHRMVAKSLQMILKFTNRLIQALVA